jgi:hypothetical protein
MLRKLLVVHGLITLAAALVLCVAPGVIPRLIGIELDPHSYLVAYLLAGAEFGLAVLSFGASRLTDPLALRYVVWSLVSFHAASAILELYAYASVPRALLLLNVAARALIALLLLYFAPARALKGPAPAPGAPQ